MSHATSSAPFTIKRGDLLPSLVVVLYDGATGVPVNLTGATSIKAFGVMNNNLILDRSVTGNAAGVITLTWQSTDTAEVGELHLEFQVMWPSSKPQTFPADGYVTVNVTQDLAT